MSQESAASGRCRPRGWMILPRHGVRFIGERMRATMIRSARTVRGRGGRANARYPSGEWYAGSYPRMGAAGAWYSTFSAIKAGREPVRRCPARRSASRHSRTTHLMGIRQDHESAELTDGAEVDPGR